MEPQEVAEHIPALRRYARSLVRDPHGAEDLVQDTLERALRKRALWQAGNLRGWLMTVMHNVRMNQLQRPNRVVYSPEPEERATAGDENPLIELIDVRRAFARLTQAQQQLVAMAALGDLGVEDMALALGIPVGTVLSRVSRGRSRLRALAGRDATPRVTRPPKAR